MMYFIWILNIYIYTSIYMKKQQNSLITQSYLRKENQQLKQQIIELKELLQYNKNALKVSINYNTSNSNNNNQGQEKPFQKLINNLYNENTYLKDLLKTKQIEIDNINSKVLINQQIVQACEDHQKNLVQELKGKIIQLKLQIKQKQKRILQLQKVTPQIDIQNSLLIKYQQITNPSLLAVKYHDEAQIIRQQLKSKNEQLQKQKQTKSDLFKLNIALTKQMNDLKTYTNLNSNLIINPNTNVQNRNNSNKNLNEIIQCHKKMFNNNQSMSQQQQYSDISSPQEQINQKKKQKVMKIVPKLQLGKAKQIQQIIVKKINAENKTKGKTDLIKNQQLQLLKKSLNRQMLKNLMLTKKFDKILRILKETEQRNIILLRKLQSKNIISTSSSSKQPNNQLLQMTLLEKNPYEEVMQLGKDIYLNQNIERVINGDLSPQIILGSSRSFC